MNEDSDQVLGIDMLVGIPNTTLSNETECIPYVFTI